MKKLLSFLLMFSLLSFSLFSTGCGRSGGSGLLKGLGIVSLVALTVSTGGAANLAFAANVRGAATQAKINPKDVVIRVYDIKDTANHLFELAVENETNANGELVCNIENKIEAGKEYIFVAYHKVKKQAFMRAGMAIATNADTAVAISPKSEVQVRMYEEWKKDPKLVTEAEKSFNNFTKNNAAATITTTELDLVVDKYVENVAKWVKDEVTAIEEVDVSDLVEKVGKEDLTASEEDERENDGHAQEIAIITMLGSLGTSLDGWTDLTATDIELIKNKQINLAYIYDNDFDEDVIYAQDSRRPSDEDENEEIVDYNINRWLKVIPSGSKQPYLKFTTEGNKNIIESCALDIENESQEAADLTLDKTNSTITVKDGAFGDFKGTYTIANGYFMYDEEDDEDEEEFAMIMKKYVANGETYYFAFTIIDKYDEYESVSLDQPFEWFLNEYDDYEIYKLSN